MCISHAGIQACNGVVRKHGPFEFCSKSEFDGTSMEPSSSTSPLAATTTLLDFRICHSTEVASPSGSFGVQLYSWKLSGFYTYTVSTSRATCVAPIGLRTCVCTVTRTTYTETLESIYTELLSLRLLGTRCFPDQHTTAHP